MGGGDCTVTLSRLSACYPPFDDHDEKEGRYSTIFQNFWVAQLRHQLADNLRVPQANQTDPNAVP